mmetsp:Transcript_36352/g.94540  ORF Transcript_36352/g.94540 Transcript_36352/m.94540 type:complete len:130 (-) Transcript_36352:93-482(-)
MEASPGGPAKAEGLGREKKPLMKGGRVGFESSPVADSRLKRIDGSLSAEGTPDKPEERVRARSAMVIDPTAQDDENSGQSEQPAWGRLASLYLAFPHIKLCSASNIVGRDNLGALKVRSSERQGRENCL